MMSFDELKELLWVLNNSQISEDVTFGPAVSLHQQRSEKLIKVVKREMKKLTGK